MEQLRDDIRRMGGQGLEEGIARLSLTQAAKRLESLTQVLARSEIVDSVCCAVGRRVWLRDERGQIIWGSLVFPGEEGHRQHAISAGSALGAAILGACPGEMIRVDEPAGARTLTVIGVD
jgi:transcription elongation GreA/GreB family factor